jgi:NADH-quinone oxidoreductase subunit A
METQSFPVDYLPLMFQLIVALGFVVLVMVLTHIIGGKRRRIRTLNKEENFECGIEVKGNARFPFSIKYFLVAILFVLFDIEIIFFYPWALNFRDLGWQGFIGMILFVSFFFAGFYYVLKKGTLKWND